MTDRDKIIEVMAIAIEKAFWADSSSNDLAETALTAYESYIQASGMAVVPVEPTSEMVGRGFNANVEGFCGETWVRGIWAAMLAASPYRKAVVKEASTEGGGRSP